MLPLIFIGATPEMQELMAPLLDVARFYPTAEAAHRGLQDAFAELPVSTTEAPGGAWPVHVAYGPGAFGPLAVARIGSVSSARLAHTGYTIVLGHHVDGQPGAPRPVIDGQAPTMAEDRSIWQAATAVHADLMLDLATTDAPGYLASWLATR